jgi:hypothetical protein
VEYLDYNRTVIGYHGTRLSVAREIVQRLRGFDPSRNPDDWLGHGVYFWEHAPKQALAWAKRRADREGWGEPVAVLGSMIRLGNCLDVLDPVNTDFLVRMHAGYVSEVQAAGLSLPTNVRSAKYLDCAVMEYAYRQAEAASGRRVESCRAMYVGTGRARVWPSSWIVRDAHIQLCVRDPACILGTWLDTVGGADDVRA